MREKIAQTDFIQIESDKKLEYDERERETEREKVRERLKITHVLGQQVVLLKIAILLIRSLH